MHVIGPVSEFANEGIYPIKLDNHDYLLIRHAGQFFCIEDKCGHFGVPLATGRVKDNTIYCREHGIGFDLFDGKVRKSMGEDCDPVKVVKLIERDNVLYCKLPK